MSIRIAVEEKGALALVRLEGRLDTNSTPFVEKQLTLLSDKNCIKVIIDFSKVDYLSSAGLRLMLSATKKWKSRSGNLVFCSMSEEVMEIVRLAGFERILKIYSTESEALQASQ